MKSKLLLLVALLFVVGAVPAFAAPAPTLEPLPLGEMHNALAAEPAAAAQVVTGHNVVLTWAAPADAVATSTYDLFRINAVCPVSGLGGLTFTKVNTTPITALTFTDATITVGNWCYYMQQNQNGASSVPSNTAGGQAKPNTVTIQIVIN